MVNCDGGLNGVLFDIDNLFDISFVGLIIVNGVIIVIVFGDLGIEDDLGNVVIYVLMLILVNGCVIWVVVCILVILC